MALIIVLGILVVLASPQFILGWAMANPKIILAVALIFLTYIVLSSEHEKRVGAAINYLPDSYTAHLR